MKTCIATAAVASFKDKTSFFKIVIWNIEEGSRETVPEPNKCSQGEVDLASTKESKERIPVYTLLVQKHQSSCRTFVTHALRSESSRNRSRFLTFYHDPTVNKAGIPLWLWNDTISVLCMLQFLLIVALRIRNHAFHQSSLLTYFFYHFA